MAEKIFRNTYLVGDGVPCVGCVDDDGIIYDNSEPSFFHQVGCVTPEGEVYETTTKTLGGQIGLVRDGNVYDFKQGIGFGDAIAFFDGDDLKILFSNGMPDSIRVGYTESSSVYARGAAAYFLLKGKMAKPKGGYSYAWKKLNDQQPASNDNGQSSPYTSSDSSSRGSNASGFIPVGGGCLESLAENFIIFLLGLGGLVMFLNFADKDKRPVLYWTVELSLWALLIFGVYKLITRNMTEEEKAEKLARIKSWFSGIRINAPKISIKKPDSAASWNNTVQNYGQKASSGSPYTSSGSYTSVNNSGQSGSPYTSSGSNQTTDSGSNSGTYPANTNSSSGGYSSDKTIGQTHIYTSRNGDTSNLPPEAAKMFVDMFGSGDEVKVGTKADNDPDHVYLICECGTNLRFPADMGILEYTCPKCGHKDKVFTGAKYQ